MNVTCDQEYKVSKNELNRRKKAFLSLSIFLIGGLFLFSELLKVEILSGIYITYILALIVSNLWIGVFFKKLLEMKIILTNKFIERKRDKTLEKFLIDDIYEIKIKKTVKGKVREIYIYLKGDKSVFINGIDNLDDFTNQLSRSMEKKVNIVVINEHIDFDSEFFYPTLGLMLALFNVCLFKFLYSLNYQTIRIVTFILLVFVTVIAIFLIRSKPIARRYGTKQNN